MIQRSRLIVNHKCKKKIVGESSRRVDTIESMSRRPKKSERPSRRYNAIGQTFRFVIYQSYHFENESMEEIFRSPPQAPIFGRFLDQEKKSQYYPAPLRFDKKLSKGVGYTT